MMASPQRRCETNWFGQEPDEESDEYDKYLGDFDRGFFI